MPKEITVIVVDDHAIFRKGVSDTLALEDDLKVIGEGASASEALDLVELLNPTVALIDLSMPGGGIKATSDIHARYPDVKIIILTASEEDVDIMNAIEAGAFGYVLKDISGDELTTVVRTAAKGQSYMAPTIAFRLAQSLNTRDHDKRETNIWETLTSKQQETLRLIGLGLTNQEIADRTGVRLNTVKFHVAKLLAKLGLRNRVELAVFLKNAPHPPVD